MKEFTIKIIPPSNRRVWQVSIPVSLFWTILVGVGLIILFSIVDISGPVTKAVLKGRIALLKTRNTNLKQNYVKLEEKLGLFDGKLVELQEICDNVLILNSLPPIFQGKENLSMGGIGLSEVDDLSGVDESSMTNDFNIVFSQVELKLNLLKSGFYRVVEKMENSVQKWEHVPTIWPADGWISSTFGWRKSPFNGQREFHTGLDIANMPSTPIKAAANGYVVFAGWFGVYGNVVMIEHGFGYETRYGHMDAINVRKGQYVSKGQYLGTMGDSGRSTGTHLHYEVIHNSKLEDPMKYLIPEENKVLRGVTRLHGQ
ncbi:MAG TPA: M23 family metallopeptidase [Candidatus Mcinerneyibacteriales bacterium]|nr:M23 family metallopeptidase [Candidatus Mcinerneyibacteriales bacterium]